MLNINFLGAFVPLIVVVACSKYIVGFYGPSFVKMQPVLLIGVLSTVFNSIAGVFNQEFISLGRNWLVFFIGICREAIYVAVSYLLLVNWDGVNRGALYVSSAYTISIICSLILFAALYYRGYHRKITINRL